MKKNETVELIGDFINYLRFVKRERVNSIVDKTGLTRPTVNDLYNKTRQHITPKVYNAFKMAYGSDFEQFQSRVIESGNTVSISEKELNQLIQTNAEMARAYTDAVDKLMQCKAEIEELRRQLSKYH